MDISRRSFLFSAAATVSAAPRAYGAAPSQRQLDWHKLETYAFLHFTINTFTDKEWGYGDEDPSLFNPTAFDPDAIVAALAAGGMKGVILTCKHHDGFCLWPTRTTGHSVRKSTWRGGRGDVVREISEAAARHGLKFGVYLSPWDRNAASYSSPEYVAMYRAQLRELLTGYGPVFEVWHDGANGGDGFYGGAREKRLIDKHAYYDWPRTWDLVRSLQPGAVIFSDVGPDVRWVGNEKGIANETCWATYDPAGERGGPAAPGDVRAQESGTGTRNGKRWLPAECDVSIRPGWFWHERENDRVKTHEQLIDLYYKSVGRGASFLLNVPPDRRGLLHERDSAVLRAFGEWRRRTFDRDLAAGARVTKAGPVLTYELVRPASFNVVRLREDIRLGQRVERFAVETWQGGEWRPLADGTSIGACRLLRSGERVTASRVRVRLDAPVEPAISELSLFAEAA